ncbi:MAG: hypothetical protein EAY76_02695 [Alphaproteobacteria bacterium]|nr:MAG: hypothetical protein EAY76_02695 [Alphaproteobacteria bacterium]TAF41474.1 MAG: hypothetical protein EAZ66_01320 [Alphaproteobacteria bacterium]TAF75724.1 MAG: hypothetical protein EAZ52_06045 [Alphaproteobacteria bacterium]
MNQSVHATFDPKNYLLDRRIMPERVAFRDKENGYVWVHPDDLKPARRERLKEKLINDCTVRFPEIKDCQATNTFISVINKLVPKDPHLSDNVPESYSKDEVESMASNAPLSTLIRNISDVRPTSEAEWVREKDAVVIYYLIDHTLTERGYPGLLKEVVDNLAKRGIDNPEIERLFHELRGPLKLTTTEELSTTELIRTIKQNGVEGVASLLNVDPHFLRDLYDMVEVIAERGFPLNDVINWKAGRSLEGMHGASPQALMEAGLHARIDAMMNYMDHVLRHDESKREEHTNEHLVVAALSHVPPILAELFFEEGGKIIFTPESDLRNLRGIAATGYHVSYNKTDLSLGSLNHIYISQDLGLPDTTRTIVHELHHLFYPQTAFISEDQALYADELVAKDQQRLRTLKSLANFYEAGDEATKKAVMEAFASISLPNMPLDEALRNVSMTTFLGAINEAYHFLQMESPTYNRISTYNSPLDRYRELIPRYSEMRFVEHADHKEMLAYIVPGITEIYKDIYIPHLEARLDYLNQHRPSIVSVEQQRTKDNPDYGIPAPANDIKPFLRQWHEQKDGIIVTHPIGDTRSVGNGFQPYNAPDTTIGARTIDYQGHLLDPNLQLVQRG